MTYAKTDLFDATLQTTASFFKVLSHPARLAILKFLAESKTCISGDISNEIPLGRTTVNQHIKELKEIGLIKGNIEGVKINYCLDKNNLNKMKKLIGEYLDQLHYSEIQKCN